MSSAGAVGCVTRFFLVVVALIFFPTPISAANSITQALENDLRERFPRISLDSAASLTPARESIMGRETDGMRAQDDGTLRLFYPNSYDQPLVAETGEQRVVLRAVTARPAQAMESDGKIFYSGIHDAVDAVELPRSATRSEELLILRDDRAPSVYEYEVVEMTGVSKVKLVDGSIRFLPDRIDPAKTEEYAGARFLLPQQHLQIDRPWVIDAHGNKSTTAARWTLIENNGRLSRIRLTVNQHDIAYPIIVDPSFSLTSAMASARWSHTAVLLPTGQVLIIGGSNGDSALKLTELFDPDSGASSDLRDMTTARIRPTATVLPNGKVLVVGGFDTNSQSLATAEIYNPSLETFNSTSAMAAARANHTATLLRTGQVLVAGGLISANTSTSTAEIYDWSTESWTATGNMSHGRSFATATLLPNGKVLITGGWSGGAWSPALSSAELYDPATGAFTAAGSMTQERAGHTATLLRNGKVLVSGGRTVANNNYVFRNTAELYDPTTNTWMPTGTMAGVRSHHQADLLSNGTVIVTGGEQCYLPPYGGTCYLSTAETYDPISATWTATATMRTTRSSHTATLLPNGKVLVSGGINDNGALRTNEIFDSTNGSFASTGNRNYSSGSPTTTLLPNGKVLLAGGYAWNGYPQNGAELYDPATGSFATTGQLNRARSGHTATLLPNGKVLIAGYNSTAELYDTAAGTFSMTGVMVTTRYGGHTATLLPNGKVLIAGGNYAGTELSNAEIYDPRTGTFSATGNLLTARSGHSATLLLNGKVLIAGGWSLLNGRRLDSAELYDPDTGTFSDNGSKMANARTSHTATLLPHSGNVLITGDGKAAEIYDTYSGAFGQLTSDATVSGLGTLLPNGKVLTLGGDYTGLLFDPFTGKFTSSGSTTSNLSNPTLLTTGKVLLLAGPVMSTAELFDAFGWSDTRVPQISSISATVCQPATIPLSGISLTGDSEGSSGTANSSPSNTPLLRLRRVDNDQQFFIMPAQFSPMSFTSEQVNQLPQGHYRAAIYSNAVASEEKLIAVGRTPPSPSYNSFSVANGSSQTLYPWWWQIDASAYSVAATASTGFTGTLSINAANGAVTVSNAGPVGTYTVSVSTSGAICTSTATFTLNVTGPVASLTASSGTPQSTAPGSAFAIPLAVTVRDSVGHALNNVSVTFTAATSNGATALLSNGGVATTNSSGVASVTATANAFAGAYLVTATSNGISTVFDLSNTTVNPPLNVQATAITSTSVSIVWSPAAGATYEISRTAAGGIISSVGTSTSGSIVDPAVSPNSAYLYRVREIAPERTSYSSPDLAVTIIFTDPTLTIGSTRIKAAHFSELRSAINAISLLAGSSPPSWSDATLAPFTTRIKILHLTELRTALNTARALLQLPAITFANSGTPGRAVRAADVEELRNGVK